MLLSGTASTTGSTSETKKKAKSAPTTDKKKKSKGKKASQASIKQTDSSNAEPSVLKYILDFGKFIYFRLLNMKALKMKRYDHCFTLMF